MECRAKTHITMSVSRVDDKTAKSLRKEIGAVTGRHVGADDLFSMLLEHFEATKMSMYRQGGVQ